MEGLTRQCAEPITLYPNVTARSCSESSRFLDSSFFDYYLLTNHPEKRSIVELHIPLRVDAFRGRGQASSGRQDVGHKGVATGRGVLSLYSFVAPAGSRLSRLSRWSRHPSFHVLSLC